ncbi:hypothetical protein AB1L42_08680 [Thalassoglobus sp. JC818]|uniref:hypothetical protein n=1 Tax=Thalassoglobus sp. JC818 TaxID=3232136 RepID=UPI003459233C
MKPQTNSRFETHMTLLLDANSDSTRAKDWATAHDFKWTHIVLDSGNTPSQPMISFRGQGTLEAQLKRSQSVALQLAQNKFQVARTKIELELPVAETQIELPPNRSFHKQYFEHHFKLLLPRETDFDQLSRFVKRNGGHLSLNARRHRDDGMQERFVTQRVYKAELSTSYKQFNQLIDVIHTEGIEIVESEHEFVLYDTNFELDSGWMERT